MLLTIIATVLCTFIVTLFLVLLALNLTSSEKRVQHDIKHEFGVEDDQFCRSSAVLLDAPILEGNSVETIRNGCRYFPAMLEAISSAQHTICFESFIYVSGDIGAKFGQALIERCKAGVKVHVLVDWVGSWRMRHTHLQQLIDAGISVEMYRPLNLWNLTSFNNRTHRKILVVDGKLAFTGGAGIADEWDGDADHDECWRDNQYRVKGPIVAQIQGTFMDNWMQTHAEVLKNSCYFPELKPAGNMKTQVFNSGPGEGVESARLMVLLAVACAKRTIRLANAYFVPDNLVVDALVAASKRGVKVEIILPSLIDTRLPTWAGGGRWGPLLRGGCKIYRFQGALFHVKLIIIDEFWVSVGSSNFDTRSFRLNDEMNLNIYDHEFARQQVEYFEEDKNRSEEVTIEQWETRPWQVKLRDRAAATLRSQL